MKISVMQGEDQGKFVPVVLNGVDDLVETITKSSYSLGTFADNHRTNNNFKGSQFVGLDFDEGMSLAEAELVFSDYQHIIATTKSHQKPKGDKPACDRFRVILSVDKLIETKEDYKATVTELLKTYPEADKACSDAARFFYPSGNIVSVNKDGKRVAALKYEKPQIEDKPVIAGVKGNLATDTLKFICMGADINWNPKLHKAAIDLHEQGYCKQEAISLLSKATIGYDGELDETDLNTIDSAYNNEPKYSPRGAENLLGLMHPLEISKNAKPVDWLVDGMLSAGGISMFVGAPKSGKSTLTRQLAMAVSRGGSFLGRKVKKGKTIYLALEEQENMLGSQLKNLGIEESDEILMKAGPIDPGVDANQALHKAAKVYEASLIVIDTMLLMTNVEDVNNYNLVYQAVSKLRNIARDTGAHIVMIHHKNKGASMRADSALGTSGLSGAVDCTFVLNETNNRETRIINTSQRGGNPFNNQKIKYIEGVDMYEISNEKLGGF